MMLEIRQLDAGYGDVQVLRGVDMHVGEGEIVSLVAPTAPGKARSSARSWARCPRCRAKSVSWANASAACRPTSGPAGHGAGHGGRRLFGHMDVEDNLLVGADVLRDKRRSRENLDWVYQLFPRLRERRRQLARSFSGGEQQMLAIGRAS